MQTRSWRRTRVIWPCNDVSTVMLVAPKGTRLRRMALLYGGLVLGGVGLATFVVADLGLDPWDVAPRKLARRLCALIRSFLSDSDLSSICNSFDSLLSDASVSSCDEGGESVAAPFHVNGPNPSGNDTTAAVV